MRHKFIWLLFSFLVVVALILAACGPEATTTPPTTTPPTTTPPTTTPPTTTPPAGPQYGGTMTLCVVASQPGSFDPPAAASGRTFQVAPVYSVLANPDWSRGPSGTKEFAYDSQYYPEASFTGFLAQSWEKPDTSTVIVHLKQGIKFQNKAPVSGRELVAGDVVSTFQWMQNNPRSYFYKPKVEDQVKCEALDKYTVKYTLPKPDVFNQVTLYMAVAILPSEMVGGKLEDWRSAVGTGPFFLIDYVADSSITFQKNPDYWQKDPLHPGNKLPYLDRVVMLLVADKATMLAGLRTGKIDQNAMTWDDAQQMQKTNPELNYRRIAANYAYTIMFRDDRAPFNDIRVRKALAMGTDRQAIIDQYYKGNAALLEWPVRSNDPDVYTPVDKLSPAAREIMTYDATKAKQLLADAGFPTGMKQTLQIPGGFSDIVDLSAIVKDQWAKIGVNVDIKVVESGSFYNQLYGHLQDTPVICHWSNAAPWTFAMSAYKTGGLYNYGQVADKYLDDEFVRIQGIVDLKQRNAALKALGLYAFEQCFDIQLPLQFGYQVWQPWLKGYTGESSTMPAYVPPQYAWIDQALKAKK